MVTKKEDEKTINDVELDAILADDSKPITGAGASDGKVEKTAEQLAAEQKDKEDADKAAKDKEEASHASVRENDRVRKLAEENTKLKEQLATQNATDIDKFVNSIADEPSRNLLKTYGDLLRADINKRINPVVDKYQESRFEDEFKQFGDKIPELAQHKEEIKKQYMRNPSLAIKSLVGDTLLDIQTSKIKPLESDSSIANRGKQDIGDATKDELYAILESRPPLN